MKGLGKRLTKVAQALADRPRSDQFDIIEVVPVGTERAEGLPPGLHRTGPDGSTVGLLVFDPAHGEPVVPPEHMATSGLVIRCVSPHEEHLWATRSGADHPDSYRHTGGAG